MLKASIVACVLLAAGAALAQSPKEVVVIVTPPAPQNVPSVPDTFTPTETSGPVPMVPATSPQVTPMKNSAPSLLAQNGQILMSVGEQQMMMGALMDTQPQHVAPIKWSVVSYQVKQPSEALFDEALRIISTEKYSVRAADRSTGVIKAAGKPWGRPNTCAAVFLAVPRPGTGDTLKAIFATYPGCIADKSPQKFAASFEKDLRKLQPELQPQLIAEKN